jgi:hypothetical protein
MKSQILKPTDSDLVQNEVTVFLAGTIEMGKSEDWQSIVQERLKDLPVTFFNPRRDSWDSSWEQRETNQQFNHQVNWEMNKLNEADIIFMNLLVDSKSPISLLELGLNATSKRMIICCPPEFYRRGNVEIVCSRFGIPIYNKFEEAIGSLTSLITSKIK